MKTMSYSQSRANYAATLDAVEADREEVVITRAGHELWSWWRSPTTSR